MGDPECQVILPRLQTDLVKIIQNTISNNLFKTKILWQNKKCMTIVLCAKGYPRAYKKNLIIKNLSKIKENKNTLVFHAGTKKADGKIYASGGRVLNFISLSRNFIDARENIHKNLKNLLCLEF